MDKRKLPTIKKDLENGKLPMEIIKEKNLKVNRMELMRELREKYGNKEIRKIFVDNNLTFVIARLNNIIKRPGINVTQKNISDLEDVLNKLKAV